MGEVCVVLLEYWYDFDWVLFRHSSVVKSYFISVIGLREDLRMEMLKKFPLAVDKDGIVKQEWKWALELPNFCEVQPNRDKSIVVEKAVSMVSFVRGNGFSIVGTTESSSECKGHFMQKYSWTLQK